MNRNQFVSELYNMYHFTISSSSSFHDRFTHRRMRMNCFNDLMTCCFQFRLQQLQQSFP